MGTSASLDVQALSDALNMGSLFLQSRVWMLVALVPCMVLWLLYLSVLQYKQQKHDKSVLAQTLAALKSLQEVVAATAQETAGLLRQQEAVVKSQDDALPPILENSLSCIDAKLLQLEKESNLLRSFVDRIDWEQSIDKLEKLSQATLAQAKETEASLQQWHSNVPPKIKEIHQFTSPLGAMNKALQALAIDCQKQFAAETTQDGVLRQGREALHYTQGEMKAIGEKLATMETAIDFVKADTKQLTTDLHVAKTRLEQKVENTHHDLKQHVGWVQSNMRGLGVMVPQSKDIQNSIKDLTEYAVLGNKHDTQDAANVHQILEAATSTDDRLNRLESVIATQDGLVEVNEILQQVKESQAILQDSSRQILERTPKIVKRSPPSEAAGPSSTPSGSTQQPAGSMFDGQSHPIRLSEHLQPALNRDAPNIYMMREGHQLNLSSVSTADLLRALVARGQF
eukprot:s914_g10.t1